MKQLAAVVAGLLVLTGCGNAAVESGPERFSVKHIDGVKCILWSPYNGSGSGAQMECDFR